MAQVERFFSSSAEGRAWLHSLIADADGAWARLAHPGSPGSELLRAVMVAKLPAA